MDIKPLLKKSIDMHVHVGPEIIPRKFTVEALAKAEEGKLAGVCPKSHFFSTVPMAKQLEGKYDIKLVGSITLNGYVGGMNADAVRASAELAGDRINVWFPTIHSANFLSRSEYEIRPEWVGSKGFKPKLSKEITPVSVARGGRLTPEAREVLKVIKDYGCILSTGHISWQESEILAREALGMGIKSVIITHPIYQLIQMPPEKQRELGRLGAWIEQTYAMHTIDKIPMEKIAEQIKFVGAERCLMSSDMGQPFSPNPSLALAKFAELLMKQGIKESEIKAMLTRRP